MEAIRSPQDAEPLLKARGLSISAKSVLEKQALKAIKESKVLTEDQVEKLELCSTFTTQHYVIFLINDTSGNEPVGILWAYAEKINDDSGFLFSYGSGNSKTDMKIRACSLLTLDSRKQKASYSFGGELVDQQGEITFKAELTNEQFASQITEIVNVDGGGRKRLVISTTEEQLSELTASSEDEANDPFASDDGEGA